jgi:hypothetical protein
MDKNNVQKLYVKPGCPICGSSQFSVSPFPEDMRPPDIDPDVLGVSDCRGCQRDFLIAPSPELLHLFATHLENMLRENSQLENNARAIIAQLKR